MTIRTTVLGATLAIGLAFQVSAQTAGQAIQSVIQSQYDAFLADDLDRAFTFASPMIQGIFGSPERFGQMVRNGYPMVWRPSNVEFTALTERGGRMYQNVLITDQAGALHLLEYEMIQTEDGWEINGVSFKRPGGLGA